MARHRFKQQSFANFQSQQGVTLPQSYFNLGPDGRLLHPTQQPYPAANPSTSKPMQPPPPRSAQPPPPPAKEPDLSPAAAHFLRNFMQQQQLQVAQRLNAVLQHQQALRAASTQQQTPEQQQQQRLQLLTKAQTDGRLTLMALARTLMSQALAPSSRLTANSAERRFIKFLDTYAIVINPAQGISTPDLACYIAHLWNDPGINSYNTISNYISNGVRRLHEENNWLWVPISDRPEAKAVLAGARRTMPATGTKSKLPVTLEILNRIYSTIDFTNNVEIAWWAAALTAFYGLFRKSNVCQMPPAVLAQRAACSITNSAEKAAIRRGNVSYDLQTKCYTVAVTHSKTNQHGDRVLKQILAPCAKDGLTGALCPVDAMSRYLHHTISRPKDEPLFGYLTPAGNWHIMDYDEFTKIFKAKLIMIGIDPAAYAGHSFRRGGATFGFAYAGLTTIQIKAMGDWTSSAFLLYCITQEKERMLAAKKMSAAAMGHQQQ